MRSSVTFRNASASHMAILGNQNDPGESPWHERTQRGKNDRN